MSARKDANNAAEQDEGELSPAESVVDHNEDEDTTSTAQPAGKKPASRSQGKKAKSKAASDAHSPSDIGTKLQNILNEIIALRQDQAKELEQLRKVINSQGGKQRKQRVERNKEVSESLLDFLDTENVVDDDTFNAISQEGISLSRCSALINKYISQNGFQNEKDKRKFFITGKLKDLFSDEEDYAEYDKIQVKSLLKRYGHVIDQQKTA